MAHGVGNTCVQHYPQTKFCHYYVFRAHLTSAMDDYELDVADVMREVVKKNRHVVVSTLLSQSPQYPDLDADNVSSSCWRLF